MTKLVVLLLVLASASIVLALISYASGWRAIAARFPARNGRPPVGRNWSSVSLGCGDSLGFGCAHLRGIFLGWSERGLYLADMWRLSIFFPPLEIPWQAIQQTDEVWGTHTIVSVAGRRMGIPMPVMRDIRDRIEAASSVL